MFERQGATVIACPNARGKPVEESRRTAEFVAARRIRKPGCDDFPHRCGARFLVAEAESMGVKEDFLQALGKLTIIVRGPKPVATMRQFGVRVDVIPENPTTEGVIEALRSRDLQGRRVGVQLYGTPNPQLVSASRWRGVAPVQVYATELRRIRAR